MLIQTLIVSAWMTSLVVGAALLPARQVHPIQGLPAQQQCPLATVYSYITITETDFPNTVTVAVPDFSSIANSLASASTVDSLVVVENSQNRPFDAPPNTAIPTFVHTIKAPGVEVTEAPHIGGSVFYLPGTGPVQTVVIGATTESIILGSSDNSAAVSTASLVQTVSSLGKNFTAPTGGWNGTSPSATAFLPTFGTGTAAYQGPTSTVTQTTYVDTTTSIVNATVTSTAQFNHSAWNTYAKRQVCVLISAQIGGHWASWCNNWDGSTTLSFTSWKTTITPGVVHTSSDMSSPASPVTTESTQPVVATLTVVSPSTTITRSVVSASSSSDIKPTSSAIPTGSTGSGPNSCGEIGAFEISFDNLPKQSVFDNTTAGLPPIFNPFDHFYWADGWSYLPPPNDPYPPHNGEQLAIYVPSGTAPLSNSDPGLVPIGGFGAGPRSFIDAYWFNLGSAWFGCDNNATDPSNTCDFVAEGYRYDNQTKTNLIHSTTHFSQPLCHTATCALQQISFQPEAFTGLSAVSFYAKIGSGVHTFYMDDMNLSWWNNTCEAGRLRSSSRK